MLVHRDYSVAVEVRIEFYSNRIEIIPPGIRRIKEQYFYQAVKPSFFVSENAIVVVLPYVIESLNQDKSNKRESTNLLVGKEKIIYDLIAAHPNIKRADIQNYIELEKSQTIELINKLRFRSMTK